MNFYVGQKISHDLFGTDGFRLPVGTVVQPDDGTHPRVLADWPKNDGFVFTDKSGFYGVEEFEILYLPEGDKDEERDKLALSLSTIYAGLGDWNRVADFVMANYEPIPEEDDLPFEVEDVDGDVWIQMANGTFQCLLDPGAGPLPFSSLDEFYGPLVIVD